MHYRVTEGTNRPVRPGELLLVDSGGQYLDGTTDITRTVAVGAVGEDERICFTRVLQGMIAMSRIRFPKGVAGAHLDVLARAELWMAGQDYDHGTGHGVGVFLSVHEGPARLSRISDVPLEAGMILSNEPGYYREGAFGIRIENLLVVRDAPALPGGDAREMLEFQTLTWVPIDRRLIVVEMLTAAQRAWIDAYHARVAEVLGPRVQPATQGLADARHGAALRERDMADITIAPAAGLWVVRASGAVLGESRRALELREGGYPPVIYFPKEDMAMAFFEPSAKRSTCPWKGEASYWSIHAESGILADAAWSYEAPKPGVEAIAGHLAFYTDRVAVEQNLTQVSDQRRAATRETQPRRRVRNSRRNRNSTVPSAALG